MYYRVIPFKRSFDTFWLVYKVPDILVQEISIWKVAIAAFWKTEIYVLCAEEISKDSINCNIEDVKEIKEIVSDTQFLKKKQIDIIDYVSQHYITLIHNAVSLYFPKNLLEKISKNTLHKVKSWKYNYFNPSISLSVSQSDIYDKIWESTLCKHLIYWVTGSWKTQIYMKIISDNLKQGKQVLLLIPEIILTSQIGERVMQMFWDDVIILHSWISQAKKTKLWLDIHSGDAKIIIGTRSSLFYPYNNLWAIIIDEEHDQSYISDNAPRFHALEVAEKISELYDIDLILWSWTPRVTTFYRWLQWDFKIHQLLEKFTK